MNTFLVRTITGLFLVLVIIGAIIFSSLSYFVLFAAVILVGMIEFYNLARRLKIRSQYLPGIFMGLFFFLANFLYAIEYIHRDIFLVFIPLLLLVFINELFLNNRRPFTDIAFTYLGLIYIALPVSLLNYMVFQSGPDIPTGNLTEALFEPINHLLQPGKEVNYAPGVLLGFFFLIWSGDTGAYLVGSVFGRRKLFPRISPNKTWEGFVGGTLFSLLVAWPVSLIFRDLELHNWLMISIIASVMGTFGDLAESMFKRSTGAKDSGKILPGHGGVLDRFDGLFFSSPVVFAYLQLIN